jgi:hypothetical protein
VPTAQRPAACNGVAAYDPNDDPVAADATTTLPVSPAAASTTPRDCDRGPALDARSPRAAANPDRNATATAAGASAGSSGAVVGGTDGEASGDEDGTDTSAVVDAVTVGTSVTGSDGISEAVGDADGVAVTSGVTGADGVPAGAGTEPLASGVTSAVIVRVFGSFSPVSTVPTRHAGTCGVVSEQAGYDTSRNRVP